MSSVHQPHISEYKILTGHITVELSETVERAILSGWQPIGSLVISKNSDSTQATFAQATVKYSEWFR